MLLETHWELTHRAGVLRDNNQAVIPKRTALLWSQRHHSFVDDREMKWNWLPENVRHKPGLGMIFAENTVYKTVRKIKFPLVKNREKPLEKSFWASQTYLTYVLVIFEAMFLLFPFQIFYTFFSYFFLSPHPPALWAATQSLDKIVEHKHFFLPTVTGKSSLGTGMLSASLPGYLNIYAVPPSSCQADVLDVNLLPRTIPRFHTSFCMPSFYRTVALEITTDNYYCGYTGWQRSVDCYPPMAFSLHIPLTYDLWSQASEALPQVILQGRFSQTIPTFFFRYNGQKLRFSCPNTVHIL